MTPWQEREGIDLMTGAVLLMCVAAGVCILLGAAAMFVLLSRLA